MKDNTSIGIDPNDDTAAIMAEIDKNIQEEQEAGTFGKDVDTRRNNEVDDYRQLWSCAKWNKRVI